MRGFEVYLEIGAVDPVRFVIEEETVRRHRNVSVRGEIAQHGAEDNDERIRLLRGAIRIVRNLLQTNAEEPIRVFNGPDVWVIPTHTVRAARIHDPEASGAGRSAMGFHVESDTADE